MHRLAASTALLAALTVPPATATPLRAGVTGNDVSGISEVSATGRFVAFASDATNLVPGDTNATTDIFLRDTAAKTTRLVTKGVGGAPANGWSWSPHVSVDGRYVAFYSDASNLVSGDTNQRGDVFRADMVTGVITRASEPSQPTTIQRGAGSVHMSDNGLVVEFLSDAPILDPGIFGTTRHYVRTYSSGGSSTVKQLANPLPDYETITMSALSPDGKFAAIASPDYGHIFVQDLALTKTNTYSLLTSPAYLKGFALANGGYPTWIENRRVGSSWVATLHVTAAAGMGFDKKDVVPYYNWVDVSRWGATALVQADKSTSLTVMDKNRLIGVVGDADDGYANGSISSDARFVSYTNVRGQAVLWNVTTGAKVKVSVSTG